MIGLILCAGFGRRLGELCQTTPKPLLRLGEHTIVEMIVLRMVQAGVHDIVINLHFGADQFISKLGDGRRYGARIRYHHEAHLQGTAGTAADVARTIEGPLLVHYGDIITDHPLSSMVDAFRSPPMAGLMMVHRRRGSNSRAWLDESGRVVRFEERPRSPLADSSPQPWVFSGICVLSSSSLRRFPPTRPLDLPAQVFPTLVRTGELFAQTLEGYRCAVDSPQRLDDVRCAVREGRCQSPQPLMHGQPS